MFILTKTYFGRLPSFYKPSQPGLTAHIHWAIDFFHLAHQK